MSLKDFAVYNKDTGVIDNVVHVDDQHLDQLENFPPEGFGIVEMPQGISGQWSTCGIGWKYENGQFIEVNLPPHLIEQSLQSAMQASLPQPVSNGAQTL